MVHMNDVSVRTGVHILSRTDAGKGLYELCFMFLHFLFAHTLIPALITTNVSVPFLFLFFILSLFLLLYFNVVVIFFLILRADINFYCQTKKISTPFLNQRQYYSCEQARTLGIHNNLITAY